MERVGRLESDFCVHKVKYLKLGLWGCYIPWQLGHLTCLPPQSSRDEILEGVSYDLTSILSFKSLADILLFSSLVSGQMVAYEVEDLAAGMKVCLISYQCIGNL